LRNKQDASTDVLHRQIHSPSCICEHAITEEPLEQSVRLTIAVTVLDGNQNEQATLYRPDALTADADVSMIDSL
jgi:hypothetical protein